MKEVFQFSSCQKTCVLRRTPVHRQLMAAMLVNPDSTSVFEAATSAIATLITRDGECLRLCPSDDKLLIKKTRNLKPNRVFEEEDKKKKKVLTSPSVG